MKIKLLIATTLAVLLCIIVFFCVMNSSNMNLKNVLNESDIHVLQQAADDIEAIQQWQPRYASEKQIEFLTDKILANRGRAKELFEFRLEHISTGENKDTINHVIDYHNALIDILEKEGNLPSIEKLASKTRPELKAYLKKKIDKIVAHKKLQYIERRLTVQTVYSQDKKPVQVTPAIQKTLERNHIAVYPKHSTSFFSWITGTSWLASNRWTNRFLKAVHKDITPIIDWHQKTNACTELYLSKNTNCGFLLCLDADTQHPDVDQLFQEGWTVKGNYTLYYYVREGDSKLSKQYDTGITIYDATFQPKESPASLNLKGHTIVEVFLHRKTSFRIAWKPENIKFSSERVENFLKTVTLPDCWNLKVTVMPEKELQNLSISFTVFHRSGLFPKWKSPKITIKVGNNITPSQIENSLKKQMGNFRNILWETQLQKKVSYLNVSWTIDKLNKPYTAEINALLNKEFPVTGELFLDADCQTYMRCHNTVEIQNQITQQLKNTQIEIKNENDTTSDKGAQNDAPKTKEQEQEEQARREQIRQGHREKLELISCYAIVSDLQFDVLQPHGVLKGHLIGSIPSVNNSRFDITFHVNTKGQVTFDKAEIERLLQLDFNPIQEELKQVPPAVEFTQEDLKKNIEAILSQNYPAIVPWVQINTGTINDRLWFRLTFNLSDYPQLSAQPYFVSKQDDVLKIFNDQARNPVLSVPTLAQQQWTEIVMHPRFGQVKLELSSWTPQAEPQAEFGAVTCTFPFMNKPTSIKWIEPLIYNGQQWEELDEANLLQQTTKSIDSVLEKVQSYIEIQNKIDASVYWEPSQEAPVTEFIRLRPFRFACKMKLLKPMGIPVSLTAGKIWVQADSVHYPQQFHLSSDETLWMRFVGISNPKFDLDLEEKAIDVQASLTPPLKSITTINESELIDLETYSSPELTDEQSGQLVEDNSQNTDSNNPWSDIMRIDAGFNGNLTQRSFGGKGRFHFLNGDVAGVGAQFSPDSFAGKISLLNYEDEILDDGSVISNPLTFDGDFAFNPQLIAGNIKSNWLGFMGSGGGSVEYPKDKPINFGVNVGFIAPFAFPVPLNVTGNAATNLETYYGEAAGAFPNPFPKLIKTLRFGFRIWRNSNTDHGHKFFFEWVYTDGSIGRFEKEYPDLAAVDPQELQKELEAEMQKQYKEKERAGNNEQSKTEQPTETETQQLGTIAVTCPDLVESQNSKNESIPNDNTVKIKVEIPEKEKKIIDNIIPKNPSSSQKNNEPVSYGNVKKFEKNGYVYFVNVKTNTNLFVLRKYDMKINDDIDNYQSLTGKRPDGSGVIILSSIEDYKQGNVPVFIRIRCSNTNTVSNVETIHSGYWNINAPMRLVASLSEQELLNRINNFKFAFEYLWEQAFYSVSDLLYSDGNISFYWKNYDDTRVKKRIYTEAQILYKKLPILEYVSIYHKKVPEINERLGCLKKIAQVHDYTDDNQHLYAYSILEAFNSVDKFAIVTIVYNTTTKQPAILLQFINSDKLKNCNLVLEQGKDLSQQIPWLLERYLSDENLFGISDCTCYFGPSGIAITSSKEDGTRQLQLIPQYEVRNPSESFVPVAITLQDWIECSKKIDTQYLPSSLQSESEREKMTLDELARIAVAPWERIAVDTLKTQESPTQTKESQTQTNTSSKGWIASPMGLLIQIGNNENP